MTPTNMSNRSKKKREDRSCYHYYHGDETYEQWCQQGVFLHSKRRKQQEGCSSSSPRDSDDSWSFRSSPVAWRANAKLPNQRDFQFPRRSNQILPKSQRKKMMTSTRHEKMKPSKKDDRTFPYQHSRSENSSPHSSPTTSRCVDRIQTRAKDGILREALLLTTTGNHPPPKQFDDDEHAFSSDEHDSNAEVDWEDKDRANTAVQLAENHDKDDDDDSTYHETTTSETSTTATTASSHSSNASTTTTTVIVVPPPPQPSLLTRFCQKTFGGRGKRKRGNTAGDDGAAWGVVDFTVKASPPQCLGLIEGICRHDVVSTNDSGNPSSSNNYYTSQRYHYLTDLCLSGRSELLPTTGRAWELLSAPLAPGRWIAKIAATCHGDHDPTTEATTARLQELQRLQRDKQADWHGQCIRLVHEDYQLTLAQPTKQRGKVRGFHTTRVDPAANRVEMLQNQGIETQDDSSAVFVGLIAIAAFDGFATKTDSSCLASALVQTVLCAMRDRWSVDRALCRVEKFTAHGDVKGEYRTKSVSGSGGVAVAVNIDLNSTAHSDGYYLQLITCEVTNQVVAVEVIFSKPGRWSFGSSTGSTNSTVPLTQQNLDQHTLSPAVNVLQFWKRHKRACTDDTMYESSVNDAHNIINDDVRNTADNNDADGMTISTDNINVGCVSYVEKSGTSRKYCTLANEKSSCLHATTTTTRNGETASCTVQPFDIMTEPCGQRYAINADRTKQTVAETLEKPRHVGTNRVTLTPHNTIVASIKVQNADGGGLITDGDLVRSLFPRSAKKPAACSFGRLARITVPIPSIQRDTVEEELNNNDPAYDFMLNHDDDETSNLTTKIYEINEEVGRAFTKKDETSVEGDVLATTTNAGGKSTTWWQHFGGMAKIRCDRHFLSAGQTQQSIADLVEKPLRQAGSTPVILTPHCTSGRATEVLHEDESSRISNDGLTRLWSPRSAEKPAASSNSLKLVTVPSLSFKRDATKSAESSEGSAIATGQMEIVPIDLLAKDNVAGRCHQTSRGIDKENAEATPSIHGGTVHDKGEGEEKLVALLGRWPPFHDIYFGRYDDQTYAEELSNEEVAFLINLDHDTNEPALHDAMFGQLAAHQEEDTVDLSCLRAWTFSVVTFSICLPLLYQLFRFLTANFTDLVLCAPLSTSGQGYGGVIDIF